MNDFQITLPVIEPDEPPRVDVHYEWTQYPIWLDGRYGIDSVDGHEIGLSPELVRDLLAWNDVADASFNPDDPASSTYPENHFEQGLALAKRVRAELPSEWIVTTTDPVTRKKIKL